MVPAEAIVALRRRLAALPARHPERLVLLDSTANLYAVSRATLYRLLRGDQRPKDAHRADRGLPRVMGAAEIERWCEIVAALKVRTTNKKGRCLSNARILVLLVEHGVERLQMDSRSLRQVGCLNPPSIDTCGDWAMTVIA